MMLLWRICAVEYCDMDFVHCCMDLYADEDDYIHSDVHFEVVHVNSDYEYLYRGVNQTEEEDVEGDDDCSGRQKKWNLNS